MRRGNVRRFIVIVMGMILAVSAATGAYAFTGGTYHDFRDGDITLFLPDNWSSTEKYSSESEGRPYEMIGHAEHDGTGGFMLSLDLYYLMDDALTDDYVYFHDDEADAMAYYENYGRNAIDTLYTGLPEIGMSAQSQWTQSEPTFFNGEWNGFLIINVTGSAENEEGTVENFAHTVYLTAEMSDDSEKVVHNVLVFYRADGVALTEGELNPAQEIADEFYDYDYANVMAGVTEDSYWEDDYGEDGGFDKALTIVLGIVGTVIPLLIIVLVIVFIVKKVLRRKAEKVRDAAVRAYQQIPKEIKEAQQSFDLDDTINKWKKRRAEQSSFSGKEQRAERRTERKADRAERREGRAERRSTMQMRTREAENAEQRYFASLQTLHKTGLLTKAEMRDMLERHERSRARQRNR